MKKLIISFGLLASITCLFAQSEKITELEKSLPQQKGVRFMEDALTLSGLYFEQGFYHKAADLAEKAYDAADKADLNEYMATALNKWGKSLAKIPNSKPNIKNKAFKHFQESNRLTTNLDLRLDNLRHLKDLAIVLEKRKELDKILKDIAVLNGEVSPVHTPAAADAEEKKIADEKLKQTLEQNEKLNADLQTTQQAREKLKQNQQLMQRVMREQNATIQNMNEEQMKQALLISMQNQVLDSLTYAGMMDSMELVNQKIIVEQKEALLREKEAEIQLKKSQRNLLLAAIAFVLLIAAGLFNRYQVTNKHNLVLAEKNKIIEDERKRSEELLLNILPAAIADELKRKNGVVTRHYPNATVLFTDFQGFSSISKQLAPEKLVNDLDFAFKKFDEIIGRHGLEKIKTIGDSYMCAGGLPDEDGSHPKNVVKAALEIQQFLRDWNAEKVNRGEPPFEARIGIHTGPLVAGVVGSKKFAYDIWGDTVNVASRMETSGSPGKVNISATTFAQVKNDFACEYRGKVPAKNVGDVEMYYVMENPS